MAAGMSEVHMYVHDIVLYCIVWYGIVLYAP